METTETLLNKKLDGYSNGSTSLYNNFAEDKEITVTITLNEYRKLVTNDATRQYQVEKAEKDRYDRNEENRKLKAKVKELEDTVFEYRKKYGDLESEEE